ncbi:MAG TPA: sulfotransferase [Candidatus Binatia bacterium]|nr:sulfotransferase [Candidatus Binatia bacterium]
MSRLPDFAVIGAARCGTTSLYAHLREHPQIFMSPEKETDYFSLGDLPPDEVPAAASPYRARNRAEYEALFRGAGGARAVGEASPTYLFYPRSAARMRELVPDARVICILRDPIERAYSHFGLARKMGFEVIPDFEAALAAEDERWLRDRSMRFTYARASFYSGGLREFWVRFPRERILVILFHEFAADPAGTMRKLYGFLGVDDRFEPDVGVRHNRSLVPRTSVVREAFSRPRRFRRLLQRNLPPRLVTRIGDLIMRPPPGLAPSIRERLLPRFDDDVRRLEALLERDLSAWRSA